MCRWMLLRGQAKARSNGYPGKFDNNGNTVKFAFGGDGDLYKPSFFINSQCYELTAIEISTSKPDPMHCAYGLKLCIGGAQGDVDGSGNSRPSMRWRTGFTKRYTSA
ncbi:uncharacterized protein LY79DRAFT_667103 [Colletotrichum navitas]|uniref:Uncharacterized protein n=1 Tax=Colletotrichum navitas TaxID=681940 RepID=A0AAD8Q6T8_9PEZI|nr:uncharacterized protein LY79DRAFT_667103 [Colletotrichum navitas]KAK1596971.1 hypothetical protein LY79DRAFT_667103 [Colletotrichum navitas]